MPYAKGTKTSTRDSLEELRRTIGRYGGSDFMLSEGATRVFIEFSFRSRRVRFALPLPEMPDPADYWGKAQLLAAQNERESEVRRRWRSLILVVKALLEAVESEILDVDEAMMGETVMPERGGATVYETFGGQIREAYRRTPLALPPGRMG
jgi:hypothetical protein